MTDRRITFGEANRSSCVGIEQIGPATFLAYQRDADDLTYTLDYEGWLGDDTIASVTRSSSGTTAAGTSNTTLLAVQRLQGAGYVDIKITTAASQVKEVRIYVKQRSDDSQPSVSDGYECSP